MFTEDRKEAKMKRMFFLVASVLAGLMLLAGACGGGGEEEEATETPTAEATETETATATATDAAGEEPPTAEEVAAALEAARTELQETISAADAGDAEGAIAAFEVADEEGLHIIIDGLVAAGNPLADTIEEKEEEIEAELDKADPDLGLIAELTQAMLPLIDEAATALGVSQ